MSPHQSRRAGRSGGNTAALVWSGQKMLALLAGGVAAVLLIVAGLVLAVVSALHPDKAAGRTAPGAGGVTPGGVVAPFPPAAASSPGQLADTPMRSVPQAASHPSALSLHTPPAPLPLPVSTRLGPAGVPTGYPRTAAGALAQLAAIDGTALSSATMTGARDVIAGWAVPDGPTTSSWSGVTAMATLLNATQSSGDDVSSTDTGAAGNGQLVVVAAPLMGLVKGSLPAGSTTAGGPVPEFVVPCLDIEVDVTLRSTARGAAGDCQRMVWHDGRWMIGAGPEPAEAPSVWPGTDLAYAVGYRDLRYAGIPSPAVTDAPGATGKSGASTSVAGISGG